MDRPRLDILWSDSLRSTNPVPGQFEALAQGVIDVYTSGDDAFQRHVKNRLKKVATSTGQGFPAESFDVDMARAFVAEEIGFTGWAELIGAVQNPAENDFPILFRYAVAALWRGDFTALERSIGGPNAFDAQIKEWLEAGYFDREPETGNEAFAAACMLGHEPAAAYLLDAGVDPYAGMRTGLAGFHYAASSGRPGVIRLLIERGVPMEVENMYGGTVLGQALWSAVYEHTSDHASIIEALIKAGAYVWPNTAEWWENQPVPSPETKRSVAEALRQAEAK